MSDDRKCGNCEYWVEYPNPTRGPGSSLGHCRRYPPPVLPARGIVETHEAYWCGEFTLKMALLIDREEHELREIMRALHPDVTSKPETEGR